MPLYPVRLAAGIKVENLPLFQLAPHKQDTSSQADQEAFAAQLLSNAANGVSPSLLPHYSQLNGVLAPGTPSASTMAAEVAAAVAAANSATAAAAAAAAAATAVSDSSDASGSQPISIPFDQQLELELQQQLMPSAGGRTDDVASTSLPRDSKGSSSMHAAMAARLAVMPGTSPASDITGHALHTGSWPGPLAGFRHSTPPLSSSPANGHQLGTSPGLKSSRRSKLSSSHGSAGAALKLSAAGSNGGKNGAVKFRGVRQRPWGECGPASASNVLPVHP